MLSALALMRKKYLAKWVIFIKMKNEGKIISLKNTKKQKCRKSLVEHTQTHVFADDEDDDDT